MKDRKPAYLMLYEDMRRRITDGDWGWGDRLPSRRQIAREAGVSAVTADHCYELLCQEGYAEGRPRSGYYVTYRPLGSFIPAASAPLPVPVRDFRQRENAFPFSVLARTMRRVLTEYGETIMKKPPNEGCMELRTAISRYLARNRGIHASPGQIVIGSGAEALYGTTVEMLGSSRIFAIEDPGYQKIGAVYLARGVRCDLLPLGADGIDSRALWNTQATVLHITPYRSFPSGVTAGASKRLEYLRWAAREGRYIVEDDFESEFSLLRKPEDTLFARSDLPNVIYLNTFSRTVSPSLRTGYMVLPEKLLPLYHEKAGFYSCTVPAFEQYVLSALLDSGDLERHINRVRRKERKQERSAEEKE